MFKPYFNGVKIDPTLKKFCNTCNHRVKKRNKDVVMAITGPRGIGKTLLSFVVAYMIQKSFSWDDMVLIPTAENVKKKLSDTKQFKVALVDEAVQLLYKMDFAKEYIKELYKRLQRERKFNRIIILNIQEFTDFPLGFRKDIVNTWVHIVKEGHAIILRRVNIVGNNDPWLLHIINKHLNKLSNLKKLSNVHAQVHYLKSMPNFAGEIFFPKEQYQHLFVKSGIEKEYEKKSIAASIEFEKIEEVKPISKPHHKKDLVISNMIKYLKKENGLNHEEIKNISGYSLRSIGNSQARSNTQDKEYTKGET